MVVIYFGTVSFSTSLPSEQTKIDLKGPSPGSAGHPTKTKTSQNSDTLRKSSLQRPTAHLSSNPWITKTKTGWSFQRSAISSHLQKNRRERTSSESSQEMSLCIESEASAAAPAARSQSTRNARRPTSTTSSRSHSNGLHGPQ